MIFLIAEDNRRMRESIRRFLSSKIPNHHTIYEATNGSEAIDLYERIRPDWVLMDIMMDPVDGLSATRAIVAAHPDARIVILTSYDDASYRKAAQAAGSRGYVLKEHLNEISAILLDSPTGDRTERSNKPSQF
jgi:DNA-binding NarL/FixJ family response regulator